MGSRIELWQLRYFVAVAEELSFRRAAERLSITQPPLTRQVRALEDEIGERLFDRRSSGVALTPIGEYLLVEARLLLESADRLFARLARHGDRQAPLRLGITTVVDPSLFTWIEPAVRAAFPDAQLLQVRQISRRSIADLRKGRLDLAIIGLPTATADLAVETLTVDPLVVAMTESHRLAKRRTVSLMDLRDDPLFWFSKPLNPAYFEHFDALFKRLGFDPVRLQEPADHHVLLGLIADGQGIAMIPKSLTAMARTGVVYKTLKEASAMSVDIAVAYLPERLDVAANWLLTKLREHFEVLAR